jgi:hypothetical protein
MECATPERIDRKWAGTDRQRRSSGGLSIRSFSFKVEDRHFKLEIVLLLLAMVMLGVFGAVLPVRQIAFRNPAFLPVYRGVVLALITVFGYMH